MRRVVYALLLLSPSSVLGASAWWDGTWCSENGAETIFIGEHEFGFNEHTVCSRVTISGDDNRVRAVADCENVHDYEGSLIVADAAKVDLVLDKISATQIDISDGQNKPLRFHKCD